MLNNRHSVLALALLLGGCGNYQSTPDVTQLALDQAPVSATGCDDLFAKAVQPRLEFCRNCHVPKGIADVDNGRKFMLSTDPSRDFANLRASWDLLGGNGAGPSRILTMASGVDPQPHSGGQPWPVGSAAYGAMQAQLLGFDDPRACVTGTPAPVEASLLGSKHAEHLWTSFCEGDGTAEHPPKGDDEALPADPRSLVRADLKTNQGKKVAFNAWWEDCHVNAPDEQKQAKTCGQFRARRDAGQKFLQETLATTGTSTSAATFNDTWSTWGLPGRPTNFDELYTLRYGLNHAPFRNPYPIPQADGTLEDPNATDGGSGQLPLGLSQLKDANGNWTGNIGTAACFQCHGGQIGDPALGDPVLIGMHNLGLGNNNYDTPMSGHDSSPFAQSPVGAALPGLSTDALFNLGIRQRGQNNAVGAFELLVSLLDLDSLGVDPNPYKSLIYGATGTGAQDQPHPIAHTQDTPAWWNMGSRPRKFFDAGVSNDSTRIIMAAGDLNDVVGQSAFNQKTGRFDGLAYRTAIEKHDQDLEAFFLSLKSPSWPAGFCSNADGTRASTDPEHCINGKLAEQGAILFHSKDLWAQPGNAARPRPAQGNGSCAGCHGAYSPRYVNDPAYLDSPVLEGVAAHISPLAEIGTDRARSDMLTPTLRQGWVTTYWGYPEGFPGYVDPDTKDPVTETADDEIPLMRPQGGACAWEQDVIGYQAPPLYGVWATAPYFHNGSVPTLQAVLDPSQRKPIWRRQIEAKDGVNGFDQSLAAYDFTNVGWKHDDLTCDQMPGDSNLNCSPVPGDQGPSVSELVQNYLDMGGWTGLAMVQDPSPDSIDKRLVYDTRILGNGNGGHVFTDVLTPAERAAIIEYLKTL